MLQMYAFRRFYDLHKNFLSLAFSVCVWECFKHQDFFTCTMYFMRFMIHASSRPAHFFLVHLQLPYIISSKCALSFSYNLSKSIWLTIRNRVNRPRNFIFRIYNNISTNALGSAARDWQNDREKKWNVLQILRTHSLTDSLFCRLSWP